MDRSDRSHQIRRTNLSVGNSGMTASLVTFQVPCNGVVTGKSGLFIIGNNDSQTVILGRA